MSRALKRRAGRVQNRGSMCVMVPIKTESMLHFRVRLDDEVPEVRLERVLRG